MEYTGTGTLVIRLDSLTFRFLALAEYHKTWQSIHHLSVRYIRDRSLELDERGLDSWATGMGFICFHFVFLGSRDQLPHSLSSYMFVAVGLGGGVEVARCLLFVRSPQSIYYFT